MSTTLNIPSPLTTTYNATHAPGSLITIASSVPHDVAPHDSSASVILADIQHALPGSQVTIARIRACIEALQKEYISACTSAVTSIEGPIGGWIESVDAQMGFLDGQVGAEPDLGVLPDLATLPDLPAPKLPQPLPLPPPSAPTGGGTGGGALPGTGGPTGEPNILIPSGGVIAETPCNPATDLPGDMFSASLALPPFPCNPGSIEDILNISPANFFAGSPG